MISLLGASSEDFLLPRFEEAWLLGVVVRAAALESLELLQLLLSLSNDLWDALLLHNWILSLYC